MNRRGFYAFVCAAAVLAALHAACARSPDLRPPQIAYGAAECELCRMIISEEPFAAAAVIVDSDGVRKVAFDDIGCLLDFLRDPPRAAQVTGYVHDYETRAWIDAANAVFVRSAALQTPMASQLAACESTAAAAALQRRFPGVTTRLSQLLAPPEPTLAADSQSTERSSP